jgi:phenylacetate-CoA ligase
MIKTISLYAKFYARHNFLLKKKIIWIEELYQSSSPDELKNQVFLKQIHQVFTRNNFYKEFYLKHGIDQNDIKNLEDINILPIINKNIVRKHSQKIKQGKTFLSQKGFTSGTSGSPLVVYRSFDAILNENAYVWWYRMQCGLDPRDKKISIRGDLNRNELFFNDIVSKTLFVSSFALNKENIEKIIPIIRNYKAKGILGYPSSLNTIASWLLDNNQELFIPFCFTSSETLLGFQKENIGRSFNTEIFDWYGNAERTISLYSSKNKYYEPLLYSINEYSDESIITTSLINNHFPLIRYEVNDTISTNHHYAKDKKSIIIDKIEGRIEDSILLSDGSVIGRLDVIFKGVKNIKMAQIIQDDISYIDVKIVPLKEYSKKDQNHLKHNLIRKLGNEIKYNILQINEDEVEKTKSGKYKLVISNIK